MVHASDAESADEAARTIAAAYDIGDSDSNPLPTILSRIG